ncbi:MAG: hypothetical protein IT236_11825 [Bacteroidia bacterium]|nr:hypothetical protein [Bacteroidia bacterium]
MATPNKILLLNRLNTFLKNNPGFNPLDFNSKDPGLLMQYVWSKKTDQIQLIPLLNSLKSFAEIGLGQSVSLQLLKKDIYSPLQITQLPRLEYKKMVTSFGSESELSAYEKTLAIKNNVLLETLNIIQSGEEYVNAGMFNNAPQEIANSSQELKKLFIAANGCACSDCTSVFSPAAYFADLNRLINDYLDTSKVPPALKLSERREDLGKIKDSCAASFDSKPYLEIVNTVLEHHADKNQSVNTLSTKTFPFNLPYNFNQKRSHRYLSHLNTNMAELYRIFAQQPNGTIVAREFLQLSIEEVSLITTEITDETILAAHYGFDKNNLNWKTELSSVPEFLYRSGLSRKQLDELLFLNLHPAEREAGYLSKLFVHQASSNLPLSEHINITNEKLHLSVSNDTPSAFHFDRLHRFIRLTQRLGWSFADLDLVLRSACGNKLDLNALTIIGAVNYLRLTWNVEISELQVLWSTLDHLGFGNGPEFSLSDPFNRLFNNSLAATSGSYTLPNNSDSTKIIYKKLFGENFPALENGVLVNSRLLGAFRITEDELKQIITCIPSTSPYDNPLSLESLSLIQRYVATAQLLNLKIKDLLILLDLIKTDKNLVGYNPFDIFIPFKAPDAFTDIHALFRSEKPTDTIYLIQLLSQLANWIKNYKLTPTQLSKFCAEKKQGGLLTEEQLRELFQNLKNKFRQVLLESHQLAVFGKSEAEAQIEFERLCSDPDRVLNKSGIVLKKWSDSYAQKLIDETADRQQKCVFKVLAAGLGVNELQIPPLVNEAYKTTGSDFNVVALIMVPILGASDITPDIDDEHGSFQSFFKALPVITEITKRFQLTAFDLEKITVNPGFFEFDLNNPLGLLSISNLRTLSDLRKVNITEASVFMHIRELLALKQKNDFALLLGKDKDSIVANFWDTQWSSTEPSHENVANSLAGLLKAKAGEQGWEILEKKTESEFMTGKRDRLVPYVIHKLQSTKELNYIKSVRDLYEYLLLDIEMGADIKTSLLQNAIATMQLYVNRCHMHLENGVLINEQNSLEKKWAWMNHYRTWEANRKVFMYPENYLQPNLRPNQSPIFKTLSQTILQGDGSEENVETAFNGYLEEFSVVANLNICGSYLFDDLTDKTLVLVGQSATSPVKTYYRTARFIGTTTGTVWSPWEEIQVTMNSDKLYPVYAFGKLFVFWVEVREYKRDLNDQDKPKPKEYKATILYTFQKVNDQWHQAQTLGEVELGPLPDENKPQPAWWRNVATAYNIELKKLGIFFGEVNSLSNISVFPHLFLLNENLTIQQAFAKNGAIGIPSIWLNNNQPTIANSPVIRNVPKENFLPITNQPDWSIFNGMGSLFLIRPLNTAPALDVAKIIAPNHISAGQKQIACMANKMTAKINDDSLKKGFRFQSYMYLDRKAINSTLISLKSNNGSYNVFTLFYDSGHIKLTLLNQPGTDQLEFKIEESHWNTWILVKVHFGELEDGLLYGGIMVNDRNLPVSRNAPLEYKAMTLEISPFAGIYMTDLSLWDSNDKTTNVGKNIAWWPLNGDFNDNTINKQHLTSDLPNLFSPFFHKTIEYSTNYPASQYFHIHRLSSNVVPSLIHRLHTGGVNELLNNETQKTRELPAFGDNVGEITFDNRYIKRIPTSKHLGFEDADGLYYWELFFHAPWLLANHLNNEQNFAEAQRWYQYIFNPTIKEDANEQHYRWRFIPLQNSTSNPPSGKPFKITWQKDGPFKKLYAPKFDGKESYIELDNTIDLTNKNFTIEFWAKINVSNNSSLFSLGFGGDSNGLRIFITEKQLSFSFYNNDIFTDITNLNGEWNHWAFTYDMAGDAGNTKSGKKIYLNGKLLNSNLFREQLPFIGKGPSFIGKTNWYNDAVFNGQLSEMRIWLSARNEKEITNSYNRALTVFEVKSPDLLCYWPLDKVDGDKVPNLAEYYRNWDLSGNLSGKLSLLAKDPFDPENVAAIRPIAYKKALAASFLGNLLDNGDALFRAYTSESITEATMYYIMASQLLGKRPMVKSECNTSGTVSANVESPLKSILLQAIAEQLDISDLPTELSDHPALSILDHNFCIPENEHFISYWDRAEDRLYKIRQGLNIDGVKQSLPLFELPIDPETWLQGATGGSSTDLNGINADVPNYRFTTMLAKAKEFAAQVSQLGNSLIAALEKKDAEALAMLHTSHERNILELSSRIKENQLEEAQINTLALAESLSHARLRESHYAALHNEYTSPLEKAQLATMIIAHVFSSVASVIKIGAVAGHLVPQFETPGTWGANVSFGGNQIGGSIDALAGQFDLLSGQFSFASNLTGMLANYERRDQEWTLQQKLAAIDMRQMQGQLKAAQIRIGMAERELEIHNKIRAQNEEIQSYMKSKFTNEELYQWMISKISGLYFNAYQMAHDLALAAEKAFQYELMSKDRFITGIYWDSLKKGLLSGEALQLDLNRMEKIWMEKNKRRFEIERTIPLSKIQGGLQLLQLKREVNLEFHLSEEIFSKDFPSHYGRQIKSISLSFPAVVGPYQNLNATLTQISHRKLIRPEIKGVDFLLGGTPEFFNAEDCIISSAQKTQQVALSRGLNDSGVFELNFNDERYLPFEGTGVDSNWLLTIHTGNGFNPESITDVIIHLQYTALQGPPKFEQEVMDLLNSQKSSHGILLNLNRDYPTQWQQFIQPFETSSTLIVKVPAERYEKLSEASLHSLFVILDLTETGKTELIETSMQITIGGQSFPFAVYGGTALIEINPALTGFEGEDWIIEITVPKDRWNNVNLRNMLVHGLYDGYLLQNIS